MVFLRGCHRGGTPIGAVGKDLMTVGERQSNLLSGETVGTQAGLTWDHSLKKNAVSNLNPQSHPIPHTSTTTFCLRHSSEHVPPCCHLSK